MLHAIILQFAHSIEENWVIVLSRKYSLHRTVQGQLENQGNYTDLSRCTNAINIIPCLHTKIYIHSHGKLI